MVCAIQISAAFRHAAARLRSLASALQAENNNRVYLYKGCRKHSQRTYRLIITTLALQLRQVTQVNRVGKQETFQSFTFLYLHLKPQSIYFYLKTDKGTSHFNHVQKNYK